MRPGFGHFYPPASDANKHSLACGLWQVSEGNNANAKVFKVDARHFRGGVVDEVYVIEKGEEEKKKNGIRMILE